MPTRLPLGQLGRVRLGAWGLVGPAERGVLPPHNPGHRSPSWPGGSKFTQLSACGSVSALASSTTPLATMHPMSSPPLVSDLLHAPTAHTQTSLILPPPPHLPDSTNTHYISTVQVSLARLHSQHPFVASLVAPPPPHTHTHPWLSLALVLLAPRPMSQKRCDDVCCRCL